MTSPPHPSRVVARQLASFMLTVLHFFFRWRVIFLTRCFHVSFTLVWELPFGQHFTLTTHTKPSWACCQQTSNSHGCAELPNMNQRSELRWGRQLKALPKRALTGRLYVAV
ncbi:membrane-associated protein, putative [Bodo saltans]|uniref:Membrane-associated protein, putative n=1 Tax=Bodo saltans TaxID=75058 RepID=A0A0S4J890_BODSA|nr:membrane-associated protein, putative [Bodo saltans]|eukprot:CUG86396.1 membrane-associated protein, putative [Bodo saltans]